MLLIVCVLAATAGVEFVKAQIQDGIKTGYLIESTKSSGYAQFVNHSSSAENLFVVTYFNITNADEMLVWSDIKPVLQEVGPFVYRQYQLRHNVSFDAGRDLIYYRQHAWLEFDSEATRNATGGRYSSDTDVLITSVNLLFLGMRVQVGSAYWHLVSDYLLWKEDRDRIFVRQTPRAMLEGYEVNITVAGFSFPLQFPGLYPNVPLRADPDELKQSSMHIGARDPALVFELTRWENERMLQVQCPYNSIKLPLSGECQQSRYPCCGEDDPVLLWDGMPAFGEFDEDANIVQGTPGDQFRPGLHGDREEVLVFFDLAQRTIPFVTTPGEVGDYFGVPVRRFRPDYARFWANAHERPANARYYQWGPSGLLNLTMLFSADVYLSPVHFLGSDQSLLDGVTGLKPDPAKHDLVLNVEPYTGVTVSAQQRAMISARIEAVPEMRSRGWFPTLENRTIYVPVAWFDIQAHGFPDQARQALDIYTGQHIKVGLLWVSVGFAILAAVLLFAWGLLWHRRSRRKTFRAQETVPPC